MQYIYGIYTVYLHQINGKELYTKYTKLCIIFYIILCFTILIIFYTKYTLYKIATQEAFWCSNNNQLTDFVFEGGNKTFIKVGTNVKAFGGKKVVLDLLETHSKLMWSI